eukprot:4071483-Alexandrium_andersonii.AAC.1
MRASIAIAASSGRKCTQTEGRNWNGGRVLFLLQLRSLRNKVHDDVLPRASASLWKEGRHVVVLW